MSAADDRALKAELRARDRVYASAYAEGLRGVRLDEDAWPDDPAINDAWFAGLAERRARRRDRVRAGVLGGLAWLARHLAPTTTRRVRRLRRRARRARATLKGHR